MAEFKLTKVVVQPLFADNLQLFLCFSWWFQEKSVTLAAKVERIN